ncbi:MAG: hypothetical protein H8E44_45320 [Planctomycetes bacterium]|nr:hypothetical protein [Planctomycetota bacterium]MBL7044207.1 hypothetical protein [Pirellulaceae bacterium]
MAKKKARVNKSQAIRDFIAANPDAAPKDVESALGKKGIKVSSGLVCTVRANAKGKPKKVAAKKTVAAKKAPASDEISLGALLGAKKLAQQLGGVDAANKAINALAQLTD